MLMPMIHYNASTIRGRDRSIHITIMKHPNRTYHNNRLLIDYKSQLFL